MKHVTAPYSPSLYNAILRFCINEYYPITVDDMKIWPHPARFAVNKTAESPTPDKLIINIFTVW
jgi:hypothetical protein